jgi:hypothetical protein
MKNKMILVLPVLLILFLAACTSQKEEILIEDQANSVEPTETSESEIVEKREIVTPTQNLIDNSSPPTGAEREFTTDFSISAVPFDEILSGGPSRDGIPPIDNPKFIPVEEADQWLDPREPVILVSIDQAVKAYPIQILMWHEIVNDTLGGTPIVVSFCPLCNTAIVFERTIEGEVLDFGTTGRLRFSNLIMYDRQTESWWQQATGEGIVGTLTGNKLSLLPGAMIAWEDFKNAHPDGLVLSRETGHNRSYGTNPYAGYDDVDNIPFLYRGPETPGELSPVDRILALDFDGETVAYPYREIADVRVVNDRVGNQDVVIFWAPGTASALDAQFISDGQDVGSAIAFSRILDGQELTFQLDDDRIVDEETGSTWDFLGTALSGPLEGEQLEEVVGVNYLWFAWAAFKPETQIYQPSSE